MFTLHVQLPHDQLRIDVPEDQSERLLSDVMRRAGLPLNTRCGQRGLCDGCLVRLLSGEMLGVDGTDPPDATESERLLGCRLRLPVTGEAVIQVPARSLLAHRPQVVTSFQLNVSAADSPLWQFVEAEPACDSRGVPGESGLIDLVRLQVDGELPIRVTAETPKGVPAPRETARWAVEHRGDHWSVYRVSLEQPGYGVAIDVGTTTVVAVLVELNSRKVVASSAALNAQSRLGDNVLTRINVCMQRPTMVGRLQRAIVRGTIDPLIRQLLATSQIEPEQLVTMTIAGNATMLHLLCGTDPRSMGVAPFDAVFLDHRVEDTRRWSPCATNPQPPEDCRLEPSADAESCEPVTPPLLGDLPLYAHLLPGAAAYVGADITAGVLATGMAYRDATCLLVDLGTNGEIVLKRANRMVGCATAAGPAFEGAGLTNGVRAGQGAISHIWFDRPEKGPRTETIEGGMPIGMCGTAYVDFLARARRVGLISPTARLTRDDWPGVVEHETHGRAFQVASGRGREPLLITEADLASLLQAKAAIAAGIDRLLCRLDLAPSDVETVFLAGGFGFHMHVDSLIGCGLLPGFRRSQVQLVGNTSLAGAYLALIDSSAMAELSRLCGKLEVVELNLDPAFESTYIDHLSLPEST